MCTVGKIFVEIVEKLLEISFSQYMVCEQRRDGGDTQHTEGEISTPPPLPPLPPPPKKKKKEKEVFSIR